MGPTPRPTEQGTSREQYNSQMRSPDALAFPLKPLRHRYQASDDRTNKRRHRCAVFWAPVRMAHTASRLDGSILRTQRARVSRLIPRVSRLAVVVPFTAYIFPNNLETNVAYTPKSYRTTSKPTVWPRRQFWCHIESGFFRDTKADISGRQSRMQTWILRLSSSKGQTFSCISGRHIHDNS